jgi:HAD superfamily hydrolase (TIGR01509 family)
VDFWGTLLVDPPTSDDRYKRRRMDDFEKILAAAGLGVSRRALDAGYESSGTYLGRTWRDHRDVSVEHHVTAILTAVDQNLSRRVAPWVMTELVDAYSRPALLVPPDVDPGARSALETLAARGYTLAVVSNTMRTPGVVLRKLLDGYGLLPFFAHTTFSDEVGIRKPAPDIFAHSLRAVGGEPAAAVHVGDDVTLDVRGARAAGMRAIHVAGAPGRSSAKSIADAVIPSLRELPAAVARLDG